MKRKILTGLLLLLVLVTSLVVHVPAAFVYRQLPPIPNFQMDGISGTLWNGKAASLNVQHQPLGELRWQFDWAGVLLGNAGVDFKIGGNGLSGRGELGYGLGGAYAADTLLSVPANMIQNMLPANVPVSVSGQFDLTVRDYRFASPWCGELAGDLAWSQGQVFSPVGTLDPGLVVASLSCDNGTVSAKGNSRSTALETDFQLTLDPEQRYSVGGWFVPGETFPDTMRSQLGWVGKPDNQGRYNINFSG